MSLPQGFPGGGVPLDSDGLSAVRQQLNMQEKQLRLQEKMAEAQLAREEKLTEQVPNKAQVLRIDVLRAVVAAEPKVSTARLEELAQWVLSGAVKKDQPLPGLDIHPDNRV